MNLPSPSTPPRKTRISAEAIIGTGMTVGMIGLLLVLLGWAQHLRLEKASSLTLLVIGAILLALGVIAAVSGGVTKHRAEDFQPPAEV